MAIVAPALWLDGKVVPTSEVSLPVLGHAAQRGSLVFDVGAFTITQRGLALFRVRDHVDRFLRSAKLVGLELGFTTAGLVQAAHDVLRENTSTSHTNGLVRWSVWYETESPDLVPREPKTHVAVAVLSLQDGPREQPYKVAFFDDATKAPPTAISPEVKAAGAYLGPMIARKRAIAAGADDVILLDQDGNIAEGPISNVFAVKDGALWTPPLGRILPGITRDTVLTVAREMALTVREEPLPAHEFAAADEAFLTATSMPIGPISTINQRELAAPGPVTQSIANRVLAIRAGEDKARENWLTFVDSL